MIWYLKIRNIIGSNRRWYIIGRYRHINDFDIVWSDILLAIPIGRRRRLLTGHPIPGPARCVPDRRSRRAGPHGPTIKRVCFRAGWQVDHGRHQQPHQLVPRMLRWTDADSATLPTMTNLEATVPRCGTAGNITSAPSIAGMGPAGLGQGQSWDGAG